MNIQFIPASMVHQTWPKVEPFIADAIREAGVDDYTVDQVKQMCVNGTWALLVVVQENVIHGATTILFYNRPNDRVALITAVGGRFITSVDTFAQLKQFAVANGATLIEGAVRASVARFSKQFGFTEKYRIVGVKI